MQEDGAIVKDRENKGVVDPFHKTCTVQTPGNDAELALLIAMKAEKHWKPAVVDDTVEVA